MYKSKYFYKKGKGPQQTDDQILLEGYTLEKDSDENEE